MYLWQSWLPDIERGIDNKKMNGKIDIDYSSSYLPELLSAVEFI
jgi:hypothetical protein